MIKNIELAKRVLQEIEENPEMHDQRSWGVKTACGTAYCIAGWACHLEGLKDSLKEEEGELFVEYFVDAEGTRYSPMNRASVLLGISPVEASNLFLNTDNETALDLFRNMIEESEKAEERALKKALKKAAGDIR